MDNTTSDDIKRSFKKQGIKIVNDEGEEE